MIPSYRHIGFTIWMWNKQFKTNVFFYFYLRHLRTARRSCSGSYSLDVVFIFFSVTCRATNWQYESSATKPIQTDKSMLYPDDGLTTTELADWILHIYTYIHVYIYFCTRLNVGTVTHCCAEVGIETKQKTKTKKQGGGENPCWKQTAFKKNIWFKKLNAYKQNT